MLVRREKYDIFAWLIVLAMCVSYLGIYGLYNPNVKNYSAHSVASLGESRGIEAGNNDMLMVDNTAGLTVQTRNIKTGNMGESLEDTWMLAAVLAAVLLSLIVCALCDYIHSLCSPQHIGLQSVLKKWLNLLKSKIH